MTDLPAAQKLLPQGTWTGAYDLVVLTYADRFLRRRRLETVHHEGFLVDLAETTHLHPGDAFELADGRLIEVVAAEEDLLAITGDLPRLAWHIGDCHTPCQIEAQRLLVRADDMPEAMLQQLGADILAVSEPFIPESGAFRMVRAAGHDQAPDPAAIHGHLHIHHHSAHHHDDDDDDDEAKAE